MGVRGDGKYDGRGAHALEENVQTETDLRVRLLARRMRWMWCRVQQTALQEDQWEGVLLGENPVWWRRDEPGRRDAIYEYYQHGDVYLDLGLDCRRCRSHAYHRAGPAARADLCGCEERVQRLVDAKYLYRVPDAGDNRHVPDGGYSDGGYRATRDLFQGSGGLELLGS
jgi:hypothetical protein